jgi:phage shock protein PspC (stress-responsive transcriptional regulator)
MTNEPMNPNDPTDSDPELDETLSDTPSDTVVEDLDTEDTEDTGDGNSDPMIEDPTSDYSFDPLPPGAGATGYSVPQRSGMVRDPYASLGGVASGIAHRYSWDVTLVRLAFVIALFASFGSAIFFYLVAWAVIPRATVWPPTPVRNAAGGFSSRDIGIGLAVLGALTFLAVGSGSAGSILVPLALVGGGVWLLTQAPRTKEEFAGVSPAPVSPMPPAPVASFATPPAPIGVPVAPRGRRKWIFRILIGFFALLFLTLAAGAITVATLGERTSDGFFLNIGDEDYGFEIHSPDSLTELRSTLEMDNGYVEVDLRDIPASDWASLEEPLDLNVAVGRGEVNILLPESLDYSLSAHTTSGSIVQSGAGNSVTFSRGIVTLGGRNSVDLDLDDDDPDLRIIIDVDSGNIEIVTDRD